MDFLVWALAVLVVLGSLVLLVQVGRHLWRHTKKLGSTVTEAADRVSSATAELQSLSDELAARQAARDESGRAPRGR